MYDEADFKTFLANLELSDDIINKIIGEGNREDANAVSLVRLGENIADEVKIIITRDECNETHTLTYTPEGSSTDIPIDIKAKVPPRNDKDLRTLLKELDCEKR